MIYTEYIAFTTNNYKLQFNNFINEIETQIRGAFTLNIRKLIYYHTTEENI